MIPEHEIEDLARFVCGSDQDNEYLDVDDEIYEKFGTDFEVFAKIVNALTPLIVVSNGTLSGTPYRGFADTKNKTFLVKQPAL